MRAAVVSRAQAVPGDTDKSPVQRRAEAIEKAKAVRHAAL